MDFETKRRIMFGNIFKTNNKIEIKETVTEIAAPIEYIKLNDDLQLLVNIFLEQEASQFNISTNDNSSPIITLVYKGLIKFEVLKFSRFFRFNISLFDSSNTTYEFFVYGHHESYNILEQKNLDIHEYKNNSLQEIKQNNLNKIIEKLKENQ